MKIAIFGATGGTGKRLVQLGLDKGFEVVAAARRPEAVSIKHEKLHVKKCDVLNATAVRDVLNGADAAISAIGPANNKKPGTLISEGVKNIVDACLQSGTKRFIFESGLMVSDGRSLSVFGRIGVSVFRALNKKLYIDKKIAERTILDSALEYTIIRPPTLIESEPKGNYKFGINIRLNPAKTLSHADVAEFMLNLLQNPKYVRTTLEVGY